MMNKMLNAALAASLLVSGSNMVAAQNNFTVDASLNNDGHIVIQMLNAQTPNFGLNADSLENKVVNTIFDADSNNLTFKGNVNVFQAIKDHYEQSGGRFSFFTKWYKRARYDMIIALVSEVTSLQTEAINGLLSQDVQTIDLTNANDDSNIAEFTTWYSALLDLCDLVNGEFNVQIILQDIPRESRAVRWTKEAAYLMAAPALTVMASATMFATASRLRHYAFASDTRYAQLFSPIGAPRRIAQYAGIYGTLGAIGGVTKAWYHNLGRRSTLGQRAKAMGWEAGKGFALGAVIGAGTQLAVETGLSEKIETGAKKVYRSLIPQSKTVTGRNLESFNKLFTQQYPHIKSRFFWDAEMWIKNPQSARHSVLKALDDILPVGWGSKEQHLEKLQYIYDDIKNTSVNTAFLSRSKNFPTTQKYILDTLTEEIARVTEK